MVLSKMQLRMQLEQVVDSYPNKPKHFVWIYFVWIYLGFRFEYLLLSKRHIAILHEL